MQRCRPWFPPEIARPPLSSFAVAVLDRVKRTPLSVVCNVITFAYRSSCRDSFHASITYAQNIVATCCFRTNGSFRLSHGFTILHAWSDDSLSTDEGENDGTHSLLGIRCMVVRLVRCRADAVHCVGAVSGAIMSAHTPGGVCAVCDKPYPRGTGCTNRCCGDCHREYCTPGGIDAPGHGINIEKSRSAIAKAEGRTS